MGSLAQEYPELVKEWNFEANGNLKPEDFSAGSKKVVSWICSKGHDWEAQIVNRTTGHTGCPYCSNNKVWPGFNDLATKYPEIAQEWDDEKNYPLTPSEVLPGSITKVWWTCKYGHPSWRASIASRTNLDSGCPYCSGRRAIPGENDLATLYPDIAAQWHPTKNPITPDQVKPKCRKKYWWICDEGHEYKAYVYSRTSGGTGCPICDSESKTSFSEQAIAYYLNQCTPVQSRYTLDDGKSKWEIDVFIDELKIAIEYDGLRHLEEKSQKRDARKDSVLKKCGLRVIRVKEVERDKNLPADTENIIYCHYKNNYAHLYDVIEKIAKRIGIDSNKIDVDIKRDKADINEYIKSNKKERSLATLYPDIAAQWHPTKNGDLTPEKVTAYANKKVWWYLRECDHEWEAEIASRTKEGTGCPFCASKTLLPGFNDFATKYPEIAKEWDFELNYPLKPTDVFPGSRTEVWWKCKKGEHSYKVAVYRRVEGRGCNICAGKEILVGYNDLASKNPKLAQEWHPTLNAPLTPQQVTAGSGKKVWWICDKGHEWQDTIYSRNRGKGCPECKKKKRKK